MKNTKKKYIFRKWILLGAVFYLFGSISAQTYTRTLDKTFDAQSDIVFEQQRGPLLVKKSTNGKVRLLAEMQVEADSKADADQFFDRMQLSTVDATNKLELDLGFRDIRNWNQNNKNISVRFGDGTKIKGLKNFKIQSTLYIPETQNLELSNRFDDVIIESDVVMNNLESKLHSANIKASNVKGDLVLNAKFGKGEFSNIGGNVTLNLHDTKVKIGAAKALTINSRFSEIQTGNITSLQATSHEDRVNLQSINGNVKIDGRFSNYTVKSANMVEIKSHEGRIEIAQAKDIIIDSRFTNFKLGELTSFKAKTHEGRFEIQKVSGKLDIESQFTDYEIESAGDATFKTHEGSIEIEQAKQLISNSRFTNFRLGKIETLKISESHEGSYEIGEVKSVTAKSAFTDLVINELYESFEFDAHEGDVTIKSVAANFKKIALKGKFYDVSLGIPSSAQYHIRANIDYGRLDRSNDLVVVKMIEKDNNKNYELKTKNTTASSAIISIEGHEAKVSIE